jgi:hypothetical protein
MNVLGVCPSCSPAVILDVKKGQSVLAHIGAHILHDPKVDCSGSPCGLCLRPWPMCQFFLKKGKGSTASMKLNTATSKGCPNMISFSYKVAEQSSTSAPCSNAPIRCPLCSKSDPAIWRYNMKYHVLTQHPSAQIAKYEDMWTLSNFEKVEMKRIWAERQKVTVKRRRKKATHLSISEAHSSRRGLQ